MYNSCIDEDPRCSSYKHRYMDLFVIVVGDSCYLSDVQVILDSKNVSHKVHMYIVIMLPNLILCIVVCGSSHWNGDIS